MTLESALIKNQRDVHYTLASSCAHIPMLGWGLILLARHPFLRFLLVGGLNTLVGYLLFLGALALSPTLFIALVSSTLLATLFTFISTGIYVFSTLDFRRLPRFSIVAGANFCWNATGLELLQNFGFSPAIAALILLPGVVAISWTINRYFVFKAR